MKQVWKYQLAPVVTFDMPVGAQILKVHEEGEEICLWALVDPDADTEPRTFLGFGTGHNIPESHEGPGLSLQYVGSAFPAGGALVFHVFESVTVRKIH